MASSVHEPPADEIYQNFTNSYASVIKLASDRLTGCGLEVGPEPAMAVAHLRNESRNVLELCHAHRSRLITAAHDVLTTVSLADDADVPTRFTQAAHSFCAQTTTVLSGKGSGAGESEQQALIDTDISFETGQRTYLNLDELRQRAHLRHSEVFTDDIICVRCFKNKTVCVWGTPGLVCTPCQGIKGCTVQASKGGKPMFITALVKHLHKAHQFPSAPRAKRTKNEASAAPERVAEKKGTQKKALGARKKASGGANGASIKVGATSTDASLVPVVPPATPSHALQVQDTQEADTLALQIGHLQSKHLEAKRLVDAAKIKVDAMQPVLDQIRLCLGAIGALLFYPESVRTQQLASELESIPFEEMRSDL